MTVSYYQNLLPHLLKQDCLTSGSSLKLPAGKLIQHDLGIIEYRHLLHDFHQESLPALCLSVGIHGNETAPIEIVCDLISSIAKGQLVPQMNVLFAFGNLQAMKEQKRFIEYNLNRLFATNEEPSPIPLEWERAKHLEKALHQFFGTKKGPRWHLDLHTAIRDSYHQTFGVIPFRNGPDISQDELSLYQSMGLEALLLMNGEATTFSYFSSHQLGCISATLELGKVSPFGQNKRDDFFNFEKTLRSFLLGKLLSSQNNSIPEIYLVKKELIKDHDQYQFHLPETFKNFTPLNEGELIETNLEGPLRAHAGESVIFPNPSVEKGQRTGLLVHKRNS